MGGARLIFMNGSLKMNLDDFYKLLLKHDWHYDMSDDAYTYHRGLVELATIHSILRDSDDARFTQLYDAFVAHAFSGEAYGTERLPLPSMPQYCGAV